MWPIFPRKLHRKEEIGPRRGARPWHSRSLVPPVNNICTSLPTVREGNVYTGVCHSVYYRHHGCYNAVSMHPTGMLLLPPANKVWEDYVFTCVCQSFCSQGGLPGQVHPPSPRPCTPPQQVHSLPPPWQVPPDRYTPVQVHPQGRYTPQAGTHTPSKYTPLGRYTPPEQWMLGDTGNKRVVCILLEYILVNLHISYQLVPIHPFWVCTGEYFYSPLHKRWGTFVVLEQPPSCSDLTCHPGHHTDQIATLSNIVFYFSCLLLSVVT